jgi:flagellar biosynthetic protein FliR
VPPPSLLGFLLAFTRIAGALVFIPFPGVRNGPEPARIVLAACLAAALFPAWPVPAEAHPTAGRIASWVVSEACIGVAAGLSAGLLIEGFLLAAQVIGLQAGYSYASTIDPTTQADSNSLLVVCQLIGGLLFFSLGLDREVLRAFAASLSAHAAGTFIARLAPAEAIIRFGSSVFATGLRLALPVIALLLLVDVCFALLGRLNSQLQLLSVAFPAKMLAALALLAAMVPVFIPLYRSSAEAMLRTLAGVLR